MRIIDLYATIFLTTLQIVVKIMIHSPFFSTKLYFVFRDFRKHFLMEENQNANTYFFSLRGSQIVIYMTEIRYYFVKQAQVRKSLLVAVLPRYITF